MSQNQQILVVDDEDVVREALSDILDLHGHRSITASSGAEAIRIFAELPRAVVRVAILDLMMPGINGIETMHQLSAIDPEIKIIISSGFDEQEIIERFHLSDHDRANVHFLHKPYTMAAIMTMVQSCLALA